MRKSFLARLDFAPDRFQIEGFDAIDAGDNVLVAAPTASGKTLVAEYAIAAAREAGVRVFYTTPIKALSNQKFADLSRWLGSQHVGLLTGDNVVQGDADVVVMTTEVLRNMIYAESPALENLGTVILDEVHYLQDSYRGAVWEEVIIQTPPQTRLVGLSATVSNATELAAWIAEVRGSCCCVVEKSRPVELQARILVADRAKGTIEDLRLLKRGRPNQETSGYFKRRTQSSRHRGGRRLARPRRIETIDHLYDAGRLPAIFFIFSRKGCEEAVRQVVEAGIDFLDADERPQVEAIFTKHTRGLSDADLDVLDAETVLAGLMSGVGSHHAGMIPQFKEAVEDCFIAGHLRVVFATETLALGVNMPARSVVIEQLSRFRGEGHVTLTPADFAQLTGRAGRRGIDKIGYACVLWSPFVRFAEAATIAASQDFELRSAFRPTYNMAANLVATRSEQDAVDLLERSFAQYQFDREVPGGESKDGVGHDLAMSLRSIVGVLTEFGYIQDWTITRRGNVLRRIFHEHDLWVAEAIHGGVLDGLDPARMAAVVSALIFRRRGPGPAPAPWFPDDVTRDRVGELRAIARRLSRSERAAGLSETPDPEPDLVPVVHVWALGIDLDELLAEEELTGGDFVRNVRRVIDLLRHIGEAAPKSDTRKAARSAMGDLDRGLVAAATRVGDRADLNGVPRVSDTGSGRGPNTEGSGS